MQTTSLPELPPGRYENPELLFLREIQCYRISYTYNGSPVERFFSSDDRRKLYKSLWAALQAAVQRGGEGRSSENGAAPQRKRGPRTRAEMAAAESAQWPQTGEWHDLVRAWREQALPVLTRQLSGQLSGQLSVPPADNAAAVAITRQRIKRRRQEDNWRPDTPPSEQESRLETAALRDLTFPSEAFGGRISLDSDSSTLVAHTTVGNFLGDQTVRRSALRLPITVS